MNKFEKNSDPKKSIGIGFFSPKYFADFIEMQSWVLQNFTRILRIDHLPDPRISTKQWIEIKKYTKKYVFLNNDHLSESELIASTEKIVTFYHDLREVRNLGKKYGI